MQSAQTNRLAHETSPYLLQHQHNPVNWFPWGTEALELAVAEDRPILLSIGYAACHWCHVMEQECFEDDEVAAAMNARFVCIKVDREERPDLDEVYMAATVALNGSGGWPMTVFLTPDQRPFFAGTYFPKQDKWGRPGFITLLARISELWTNDRAKLLTNASELTLHLEAQAAVTRPLLIERSAFTKATRQLEENFDETWGGFGVAPKFPPSSALLFLLREHARTGNPQALQMVEATLTAMSRGGIYDHIAGGFARYSTDERWFLPHFEKMLYDNALLVRVYLETFQVTNKADYARVATETLDYVIREMQSAEGGYFSATDADSEGVEGKFFVWSEAELRALLSPPEFRLFCTYYGVTPSGNWEGQNLLHAARARSEVAAELELGLREFEEALDSARAKIYQARQLRVPPLLDDKVLVSWNALMISAMAEAYRVLGHEPYRASAERAATFLSAHLMRPDGGLYRTYRSGRAHLNGYLEDYACLGDASISLYEATGNERHLISATMLLERLIRDFGDDSGGAFFHTAHGETPLILRLREGHDSALPNANAVAASALARLAEHLDREDLMDASKVALMAYGQGIERMPRAFAASLCAVERLLTPSVQLVIAAESEAAARPLLTELAKAYLPNRIVGWALRVSALKTPLLAHKSGKNGQPALYVCQNFTCQAPIVEAHQVLEGLAQAQLSSTSPGQKRLRSALPGHATQAATAGYAALFTPALGPSAYRGLGDLSVSRLGFGTYRVSHTDESQRSALLLALKSGVNLIDTSPLYTGGSAERLVGDVLQQLVNSHELARQEVVVISKVGTIQGEALEQCKAERQLGHSFPDLVECAPDLWHSIHPEWIEHELTRSLDRLGLTTLDAYLLNNPEYYLSFAERSGLPGVSARGEFYRRVARAFAHLEREVERGRLLFYGVSSNTVARPAEDADATHLESFYRAAQEVAGEHHHFRVLQLPCNLVESTAGTSRSGGEPSVIQRAAARGLSVLSNRPLNAITAFGLLRLCDIPHTGDALPDFEEARTRLASLGEARTRLASLEFEFTDRIAPGLTNPEGQMPKNLFNWAIGLGEAETRIGTRQQFLELKQSVIEPHVRQLKLTLTRVLSGEFQSRFAAWYPRYSATLGQALSALEAFANHKSAQKIQALRELVEPHFPAQAASARMSQLALATLLGDPGVCSVLVGMRRPEYVADALAALALTPSALPGGWLAGLHHGLTA